MRSHALRTAVTLYETGTVDIATAARTAGVQQARMRRHLEGTGASATDGPEGQHDDDATVTAR
jgi:hypothetical protein